MNSVATPRSASQSLTAVAGDDLLPGLRPQRLRASLSHAGGGYGTIIEGGPMKGVRPAALAAGRRTLVHHLRLAHVGRKRGRPHPRRPKCPGGLPRQLHARSHAPEDRQRLVVALDPGERGRATPPPGAERRLPRPEGGTGFEDILRQHDPAVCRHYAVAPTASRRDCPEVARAKGR